MAYSILAVNAFKVTTIVFAAAIGLFVSRFKWALIAAAILGVVENTALYAIAAIFPRGPGFTPFTNPSMYAVDLGSNVAAYLCWASAFFLLKQLVKRLMNLATGQS
jgi:ABC-type branched-subunit amino acid transport system permease subunit